MIDLRTVRVSALNNRVPGAVLAIEVVGAAVALGLLALYLGILARGVLAVVLASAFVSVLLLITFDLDRPVRGLVTVPDTPLVGLRVSMELPPAANGPNGPNDGAFRRHGLVPISSTTEYTLPAPMITDVNPFVYSRPIAPDDVIDRRRDPALAHGRGRRSLRPPLRPAEVRQDEPPAARAAGRRAERGDDPDPRRPLRRPLRRGRRDPVRARLRTAAEGEGAHADRGVPAEHRARPLAGRARSARGSSCSRAPTRCRRCTRCSTCRSASRRAAASGR